MSVATLASTTPAPSCPWDAFTPGTIRFCEDRVCGWVAEPANSWSNLAYIIGGIYLLQRALRQRRYPLLLVGITSVLVGIASFLFHATGAFFAEFIDLSAMFLIGALMVTMEARRLISMSLPTLALCFVGTAATSMLLLSFFHTIGITVFGVQVALIYASNIFWKSRAKRAATPAKPAVVHRHALHLGVTFALALGIWVLDVTGTMCRPTNHVFNGHAAWHMLTALCLYFFYRHQEQFVPLAPVPAPAA